MSCNLFVNTLYVHKLYDLIWGYLSSGALIKLRLQLMGWC